MPFSIFVLLIDIVDRTVGSSLITILNNKHKKKIQNFLNLLFFIFQSIRLPLHEIVLDCPQLIAVCWWTFFYLGPPPKTATPWLILLRGFPGMRNYMWYNWSWSRHNCFFFNTFCFFLISTTRGSLLGKTNHLLDCLISVYISI